VEPTLQTDVLHTFVRWAHFLSKACYHFNQHMIQ
jgi:hypothetical protein